MKGYTPSLMVVPTPRQRGAGGFTLVELIVVVVLLTVVGGLVAPRLLSTSNRRAEQQVREVAELLSVGARRDDSSGGAGGEAQRFLYDSDQKRLSLQVRRTRTDSRGETQEGGVWREDPLAPAVTLVDIKLSQVLVDGVSADERGWRLDLLPGTLRPTLEVIIERASTERRTGPRQSSTGPRWNVTLLPYSAAAQITMTTAPGQAGTARLIRSVDLDAAGVGDRPW